jgi:hypothetical protein
MIRHQAVRTLWMNREPDDLPVVQRVAAEDSYHTPGPWSEDKERYWVREDAQKLIASWNGGRLKRAP